MTRKAKNEEAMRQSALRLPTDLYERLKEAAGDRGLGEEIRRRLEASFSTEAPRGADPETDELLRAIVHFRKVLEGEGGWHKDRYTYEVFKTAVTEIMEHFKPEGEPTFKPNPEGNLFFEGDEPPEKLGRMFARFQIEGNK